MANRYRTHTCGELRGTDEGKKVRLSGWLESIRRHGGVAFASLRDRYGVTQLRIDTSKSVWRVFENLPRESVVCVEGIVSRRPKDALNPNMKTGEIEIVVESSEVLSTCGALPFEIKDCKTVDQSLRFKYRYLEMREGTLIEALMFRHKVFSKIREFLNDEGFVEVETPCLTRSTPEGARDYLVPSRLHVGKFYALPQSPQLFKQILMVGGVDKYYQIARCFRDEDLRADRQPEFTQLDIEMSFVEEEDIYDLVERLLQFVVKETTGETIEKPFRRIRFEDALQRYGSDAPDIRFGLEIVDASDIAAKSTSEILLGALEKKGVVLGLCVTGAQLSRKNLTTMEEVVKSCGAKGILHFYVEEEGMRSPLAKFFSPDGLKLLKERFGAKVGDTILLVADNEKTARTALGYLRRHLAQELKLPKSLKYSFLWVVDWKLMELDEQGKLSTLHHPFTSPHPDDLGLLESDPLRVRARAYDVVFNGLELGGGSIRIHEQEIQSRIFRLLGLDKQTVRERFGFLLDAFKMGAPPHGGIALGLDRFVALLLGYDSITDVIAFPKTRQATCPLTDSPNEVTKEQLRDLNISLSC